MKATDVPKRRTPIQQYGESCRQVANLIKQHDLDPDEQLYVENHLLIVQLAITASKHARQRNRFQFVPPDKR